MKRLIAFFLFFFAIYASANAEAVLVIANKASPTKVESADLKALFAGQKRLVGEVKVDLIDQPQSSEIRALFYQRLLNRTLNQISAERAELIFSGRVRLPATAADDQEVIKLVQSNPKAIGYVSENADIRNVTVVLKLSE
jgi:hypothetical protein